MGGEIRHLDSELSLYLDGELGSAEQVRVEAHLASCPECRQALEDVRRLVDRAGALQDSAPERDLWPGIAARISSVPSPGVLPLAPRRRRRILLSVPQLAAAAVALMLVSAGVTVLLTRGAGRPVATAPAGGETLRLAAFPGQPAVESYDAAIRALERTLAAQRQDLDTGTARVIEQSLAIIDRAIAQARAALERDPNNAYLNRHLQSALGRKLELLRQVATLPLAS